MKWSNLDVKWSNVECRAVIRFLYLKGCTPQETFDEMKETYSDNAPSYDLVKRWHRKFKRGRKSVETAPRPGCSPSVIDEASVLQVEAAILEDRHITIRQIAQDVKISTGSVETIIHDHLHMHKVSARWIPRLITQFQKRERVKCSRMNLEMCQEDESKFFKRLITQDETWVHHYDPVDQSPVNAMEALGFTTPKEGKSAALRCQDHAHRLLGPGWSSDDRFPGKRYHNYRSLLCFTFEEIKGSYQNQEAGQDQQRYPPPAGQRSGPQLARCQIRSTGCVVMKSFPILPTLLTLHPLTFTSSQP